MQRTRWGLVFALWAAGLGAGAQYGKYSVTFHMLPDLYPGAGTSLGWVVSLVGLMGVFFGIVAGLIVARVRYRRALLWALWLGAALSFYQATVPALPWLLLSRAAEGLTHLAIVVAAPTLIVGLCAPRDLGLALTLWATFVGVSFAIIAWAGLPLADAFGLPALIVAHGVFLLACALVLTRPLARLAPLPAPRVSVRDMVRGHGIVYRSPAMLAPAAGWLFYTFAFVAVLTVLPPFLDPELRAAVIGAMPLVSIASSMLLGVPLLRVLSSVTVIQIGFAASAAASVWLAVQPGDAVACLALAAAFGLVQGASYAAVPDLNAQTSEQAQANGAMAQTGNLGNTVGTPALVALVAGFGYLALPLAVGIAMLGGLLVHVVLALRRKAR